MATRMPSGVDNGDPPTNKHRRRRTLSQITPASHVEIHVYTTLPGGGDAVIIDTGSISLLVSVGYLHLAPLRLSMRCTPPSRARELAGYN